MNLIGILPKLFKRHGGWILTALSGVGLVGTVILTADEAPKAKEALTRAEEQKLAEYALAHEDEVRASNIDIWLDEHQKDVTLTLEEKFDIAAPIFLPAFLLGILTIGGIVGVQIFNQKQQATIAAAYVGLLTEYRGYRDKVRDEVGKEREKEIYISNRKEISALKKENAKLLAEKNKLLEENNQVYAIATIPGLIFECSPNHINSALYHLMRNFSDRGVASLAELYEFIGIPTKYFNVDDAEENGYEAYENEVTYGHPSFSIDIWDIEDTSIGRTIHMIDFYDAPYRLGLDYGGNDSSIDNIYDGYNSTSAEQQAKALLPKDIVRFELPEHWIEHTF